MSFMPRYDDCFPVAGPVYGETKLIPCAFPNKPSDRFCCIALRFSCSITGEETTTFSGGGVKFVLLLMGTVVRDSVLFD